MIENYLPAFPRRYEVEVLDELPGGGDRVLYFPGASDKGGRDGMLISVSPEQGEKWLGIFAFGGCKPVSALSSTPFGENTLCVVSRGGAYFVRADDPQKWTKLDVVVPIKYFRPIAEPGIVVVADDVKIAAYGANGLIWRTSRISFDGIWITGIECKLHPWRSLGPDYARTAQISS